MGKLHRCEWQHSICTLRWKYPQVRKAPILLCRYSHTTHKAVPVVFRVCATCRPSSPSVSAWGCAWSPTSPPCHSCHPACGCGCPRAHSLTIPQGSTEPVHLSTVITSMHLGGARQGCRCHIWMRDARRRGFNRSPSEAYTRSCPGMRSQAIL
jgi:hypothetical protein